MKRPRVSALSEYSVMPARLTSTLLPRACPVLTVFAAPVEPDALPSAAIAITAAAAMAAPPRRKFRFSFMSQGSHWAGPLHQRTLVVGRFLLPGSGL